MRLNKTAPIQALYGGQLAYFMKVAVIKPASCLPNTLHAFFIIYNFERTMRLTNATYADRLNDALYLYRSCYTCIK